FRRPLPKPARACAPRRASRILCRMRRVWLLVVLCATVGVRGRLGAEELNTAAGPKKGPRLKITGRVTFDGKKIPPGRKIFAQPSADFPGAGGTADFTTKVDSAGRFTFDRGPEGSWWLLAWVDDDGDGKLTPGKEIMGYNTINPVPIGDGRTSFAAKVDLDPILVTLVTRFEPARGTMPPRRVLESLRIVPLHPKTAKFLEDAEVIVSSKKIQLAPEGGSFLFAPDPPEDVAGNYKVELTRSAYGRASKKRLIAPRAFGAVPEAHLDGKRVEWTQPPWANMAMVRASLANGTLIFDKAAR